MKNDYTFVNMIIKSLLFYSLIVLFSASIYAQTDQSSSHSKVNLDWDICEYYPAAKPYKSSIKTPKNMRQKMSQGGGCSSFIVTYNGFTPQAEAAFQFAVDIWAVSIESPVPIRVNANFGPLDPGVLGGAGPDGFLINIPGFPSNVAFASALGEKLIGEDSDGPTGTSNDIIATFSDSANFYFGLDANPPSGQVDFVSVVLHELGHGLGLLGFGTIPTDADGNTDPDPPVEGVLRNSGFLSTWDTFIENGTPTAITSFADPSAALLAEFTGDNLFSNGSITTFQNGGVKPSTHAPSTFQRGSSYSHWDESTYPAGSSNSLMTPSIAPGEAIHSPGSVTLGFMEDMGWSICGGSLAIKGFNLETVNISPNPFTSSIAIKLSNGFKDEYEVSLLDINGRIIIYMKESALHGVISISNLDQLEDAVYFLKVINETTGANIFKKIIKN
jgi:hypothetical protein